MPQARKSKIQSLGVALVAAVFLWGCNGTSLDDGDKSDSLLVVESVTPASVQADVTPSVDPNFPLIPPAPPEDDTIVVKVENLARNAGGAGPFNDIMITSVDLTCVGGSLQIGVSTIGIPVSLSVPADSTASISVLLAAGPYKAANSVALLALGTDRCAIKFHGEDLGGEQILSTEAIVSISYVDTP